MKLLKNFILVFSMVVILANCSSENASGPKRFYGAEFQPLIDVNFRRVKDTKFACERLKELNAKAGTGLSQYSLLEDFDFQMRAEGPYAFVTGSKPVESPFLRATLVSDQISGLLGLPNDPLYDIFKVRIGVQTCKLQNAVNWGPGCGQAWQPFAEGFGCNIQNLSEECIQKWQWYKNKTRVGVCSYVETEEPRTEACEKAKLYLTLLNTWYADDEMFNAKNVFLNTLFPGVMGGVHDASFSLPLQLIAKIKGFYEPGPAKVKEIINAKLPLFESKNWEKWKSDVLYSVASIQKSKSENNVEENLCSYVLANRMFNQLIAVKGFDSPLLVGGNVVPLTAENSNSIGKIAVTGSYLKFVDNDPTQLEPQFLSNATLEQYNPCIPGLNVGVDPRRKCNQAIVTSHEILDENGSNSIVMESIGDRLNKLEALEFLVEATSPNSETWKSNKYYFGNINSPISAALFPHQYHKLALGLFNLELKNILALNLRKITANGAIHLPGSSEEPGGVVLISNGLSPDLKGTVELKSFVRFAKIVVRLDDYLEKLQIADQAELMKKSPVYSTELFSSLAKLREQTKSLKIPLQILMLRFANLAQNQCFDSVSWDFSPASNKPIEARIDPTTLCDDKLKIEFIEARGLLEASLFK